MFLIRFVISSGLKGSKFVTKMTHENNRPQCVVAIDIGSDGCGYAFSADYQFKNDPCDIYSPRWSADIGKFSSCKLPSAILFDGDQAFVDFGFNAQDKYAVICARNDQNNWYYIEGFKMALYNAVEESEDIRDDFKIKEMGGKAISAKLVFSSSIKYFYDHFIDMMDKRKLGIQKDKIHWIITVPAIWTDSCKQFTREAAIKAGIPGNKFSLVYEPEAASVYARHLQVDKIENVHHKIVQKTFRTGTKLLVVDAGGGTVDISAQEVLDDNGLKIIHKVRGGDYGGKTVNSAFRQVLVKIFSAPTLVKFKQKYPLDYIEMIRSFEEKKKSYKTTDKEVSTRIPATLFEISEENSGCSVVDLIGNSAYAGKLRVKRDKLFIQSELFVSLFTDALSRLVKDVNEIIQHKRCSGLKTIMLVGGFGECELLQNALKQDHPKREIIIPFEGGLSVLKGAVIYGHIPNIVSSRVCNYTYGVSVSKPFNPKVMPLEKSYRYDGETWCRDIFEISYQIDSVVNVGDKKQIEVNDTFKSADVQAARKEPLKIEIHISDKENPQYVTDDGCRRHAVIIVPPPNGMWPEEVYGYVELEITGTEMIGSYVNVDTGDKTSIKIEFLPKLQTTKQRDRKRVYDPDQIEVDEDTSF